MAEHPEQRRSGDQAEIGKSDDHRNFSQRLVTRGTSRLGNDNRKGVCHSKPDEDIGPDQHRDMGRNNGCGEQQAGDNQRHGKQQPWRDHGRQPVTHQARHRHRNAEK